MNLLKNPFGSTKKKLIACRIFWGLKFVSVNKLDGRREHIVFDDGYPVLFRTRAQARIWANGKYGYIKERKDLRSEPHGWKFPVPIRIRVSEA